MGKIVIEGLGIVCCGDKIIPDPHFYLFIQFLRFYSSTLSSRAGEFFFRGWGCLKRNF